MDDQQRQRSAHNQTELIISTPPCQIHQDVVLALWQRFLVATAFVRPTQKTVTTLLRGATAIRKSISVKK